jgi:hypothetical protein
MCICMSVSVLMKPNARVILLEGALETYFEN